jgi:hypothetical protein
MQFHLRGARRVAALAWIISVVCPTAVPAQDQCPPSAVTVFTNVAYGPHPAHLADICMPNQSASAGGQVEPVIVLVHGGPWGATGWSSGRKGDLLLRERCHDLAGWGFVVVDINYPLLTPGGVVTSADQLASLQLAIRWIRATGLRSFALSGIDGSRLGSEGWDAGGQLVAWNALYGATWPSSLSGRHPHKSSVVTGFLAAYGVYDLLTMPVAFQQLWSGWQLGIGSVPSSCPIPSDPDSGGGAWCEASPHYQIGQAPRSLLWLLGRSQSGDTQVPDANAANFHEALVTAGYTCPACGSYLQSGGHDGCGLTAQDFSILAGVYDQEWVNVLKPFTPPNHRAHVYPQPPSCP